MKRTFDDGPRGSDNIPVVAKGNAMQTLSRSLDQQPVERLTWELYENASENRYPMTPTGLN